jgi:type IV pilus assembly protein PilA
VSATQPRTRQRAGFTLIELMMVVAILGILASIAIPAFRLYQQRSKRSEAYANLESIRKVQLAYATEFGAFVNALPSPFITLNKDKQNWGAEGDKRFSFDPAGQGFDQLGWRPDGPTYFDYDTNADVGSDGPAFTAAAYGDVDGDGNVSVFLYVHPDNSGAMLPCTMCPGGPGVPVVGYAGPPQDAAGTDMYKTVAPLQPPLGDDF